MVKITFYYKDGCWLCDTAQEMLNGLRERHGMEVTNVDITSDDKLYELYRFDIPVFEFKDGSTLHGRIRKKDLLQKLEENKQ
ncbi:MAG TPA: glutaredoxin family protein [Dissulfurispiraceae bacterium]|nr:glutaredoxin family protein [Dissulfurispiraceae bacterium]